METYIGIVGSVEAALGPCVANLSTFCAKRPKNTIAGCLVVSLGLILGLLTIEIEFRGRFLWVDQNSKPIKNLKFVERVFARSPRFNQVLIGAKDGNNILTFEGIRDAFLVHDEIMANFAPVDYTKVCQPGEVTECKILGSPQVLEP